MIVSFYSYKGGVGRTQLCANVAAYLCNYKKKKVLIWDWDYEAPGLHYFFGRKNNDINKEGTLELLEAYIALMRNGKEGVQLADLEYITEEKNVTPLVTTSEGCIDLMAAGIYDSSFGFRATNFDWFEFYNMLDGVNYIEKLKENLKTLKYDYVLIDSRTGISDYSGICNIQLPDINVMVIAATMQNFEGCKSIIEKIKNAEYLKIVGREAKIFPVLSRLDTSSKKYDEWAQRFKEYFSGSIRNLDNEFDEAFLNEIFTNVYFRDTFIPYTQGISAGENILFDESRKTLDTDVIARPFMSIAEYLDDIDRDKSIRFYKGIGERDWLRYATEAETPRKAAIAFTQVAIKQSDLDAVISNCEKAINKDKGYYLPYYYAAIAMSTKSESFKAIKYFEKVIELNPNFIEAYHLLATEYLNTGKRELGILYLQQTLSLNPNHAEAIRKIQTLETGTFSVNELTVQEDEFYNNYVNTQIEQSKQEVEIFTNDKIRRSKQVADRSLLFAAAFVGIALILFLYSINTKDPIQKPGITFMDSVKFYEQTSRKVTMMIKSNGVSDTSFQLNTADIVGQLNQYSAMNDKYFWVFLGQKTKMGWSSHNFDFDNIGSTGTNLTATTNVYRRNSPPEQQLDSTWKLGVIVGLIEEGRTVTVVVTDSVKSTPGSTALNYWALVSENNSDFWIVQITTHSDLDTAQILCERFKKQLPDLRIIQGDKYSYITTRNFDTQLEAKEYISKYRKHLPKDASTIKLSAICNKMLYKGFYFDCR
ncbi:MAG: AAA family ATPase [Bacteroidota bacterium]